jgi:hypothetical protein
VPFCSLACTSEKDNEHLIALIGKYIVNNIQCIAEKIAADIKSSQHLNYLQCKNPITMADFGAYSCKQNRLESQQQQQRTAADLNSELSAALADFGVNHSTEPAEFGLWRPSRTELADFRLDKTSSRLPVTWSAMKTSSHSCGAACSTRNSR